METGGSIVRLVIHPHDCSCSSSSSGSGTSDHHMVVEEEPRIELEGSLSDCPEAIEVMNGEFPSRFKASVSSNRQDRISDFWKRPISKIQVSVVVVMQWY